MQSWDIDPIKGDYVNDKGSPKQTNSLKVPAYFRLKTKRQQWLYAPDSKFGSDFYTVQKRPAENGNQRLETIGASALQPIVDDGRATQVEVQITQNTRSAAILSAHITDASGNVETQTFSGLGF